MSKNTNKWRTWIIIFLIVVALLKAFLWVRHAGAQSPEPYVFYWGCDAIGVQLEPQVYDHLTAHISDGTRVYGAWLSRFDDGAYITNEPWLPNDTFRQYKLVGIEAPDGTTWRITTEPVTCGTPTSTIWLPIVVK